MRWESESKIEKKHTMDDLLFNYFSHLKVGGGCVIAGGGCGYAAKSADQIGKLAAQLLSNNI